MIDTPCVQVRYVWMCQKWNPSLLRSVSEVVVGGEGRFGYVVFRRIQPSALKSNGNVLQEQRMNRLLMSELSQLILTAVPFLPSNSEPRPPRRRPNAENSTHELT